MNEVAMLSTDDKIILCLVVFISVCLFIVLIIDLLK